MARRMKLANPIIAMSEKKTNTASFKDILAGVNKLRNNANQAKVQQPAILENRTSNEKRPEPIQAPPVSGHEIPVRKPNEFPPPKKTEITTTSFAKTSLYQTKYARQKIPGRQIVSKIAVNPLQKHNPLLESLKNVPYEFTSIVKTDYLINNSISVLFLSLKYHKLRPDYIYNRFKKLGVTSAINSNERVKQSSQLQILLLLLDSETNYIDSLRELTKLCIYSGFTLLATWTYQEAGEYVGMLKNLDSVSSYKVKGSSTSNDKFDIIKGLQKQDYYSRLLATLTSVRSVNKTDVSKIVSSGSFRNFSEVVKNSDDLQLIEGFGKTKVKRFKSTISEPFLYSKDYENDEKVKEWKRKCQEIKEQRQKEAPAEKTDSLLE